MTDIRKEFTYKKLIEAKEMLMESEAMDPPSFKDEEEVLDHIDKCIEADRAIIKAVLGEDV